LNQYGPTLLISEQTHAQKYRGDGEAFPESCARFSNTLADSPEHFRALYNITLNMRFLGGGRTQAAIGSLRHVTAFNCFLSGIIEDSMDSIMSKAHEAAETMRLGGGIGYDFSRLRPRGDRIVSLGSKSSGPVSFMQIYDAVCATISSAGHRRGAQMGVLRVDHPDIEEFIRAKQNTDNLTRFNISIGATDKFMEAVQNDLPFQLEFNGQAYESVSAKNLWDEIMRSTWDWAEPGVLFIDSINKWNNLHYCETIEATNPCGEQPLPPYGACLLGSFNLTKYIKVNSVDTPYFDYDLLISDIPHVVRAMDNIHDKSPFPLEEQRLESQNKRRMGLGVTGLANTGEILGYPYGSPDFLNWMENILEVLRDEIYDASIDLAREKGAFPLFDAKEFGNSLFIKTLPQRIQGRIRRYGIRNSHLLSIAPTGTISLCADNVSSGIEPVFAHVTNRTIQTFDGPIQVEVKDYAYNFYGVKGKTTEECTVDDHLHVLAIAQRYVDSSVSKTINVPADISWDEFGDIYIRAYNMGCKGCTTFNPKGKRFGILNKVEVVEETAKACYIDPETGQKECS
jgi:ribonucleoside-diphosphate reductase alpha chain